MYSSAGRTKDISKILGDEVKDEVLEDEFFTFIKIGEEDWGYFDSSLKKINDTQFDSF